MEERVMAQHAVGNHIYVFTQNSATGRSTPSCIIAAHGGQTLIRSTFTVPAKTKVTFYCPDGASLTGASIPDISKSLKSYEDFSGGEVCRDYILEKFQGYHANGFTGLDPIDKALSSMKDSWKDQMTCQQTYTNINQAVNAGASYDVVTIRYRPMRVGITLSQVITQLCAANFVYDNHLCDFCRHYPLAPDCCTIVHNAQNN
jgi:hypothetical protein